MNKGIEDKRDDDSEIEDVAVTIAERREIPMPELTLGSEYLVAFLHSAGTATATGMGLIGLSWQELDAWVRCTDQAGIVTSKDLKIIHMLSKVYVNEYSVASKKDAKPPYVVVVEEEEQEDVRAIVSNVVDDLFSGMMASQQERK